MSVIVSAIIGLLTLVLGYLFGNRKRKIEVSILEEEFKNKKYASDLLVLADVLTQLGYYRKLSKDTIEKVENMEKLIETILEEVCIKKNCKYRLYHLSVLAKRELLRMQEENETKAENNI